MYKIISVASFIIRQFYLANPFEPLGESVMVSGFVLSPVVLNYIAGFVLVPITYAVVGLYYNGGLPMWGSILFLFFYLVHTGVIYLIMKLYILTGILWLSVFSVLFAYTSAHILINRLAFWAEEVWL